MASRTPNSELSAASKRCDDGRTPNLNRLVPLLLAWFARNARDLPWRHTRDPYAIWVSEIMLQQTQVKTVLPYWKRWMHELPTIKSVANASPDKIHKLWEGLGYYTRARNLQKAAQQIVANCRRRGNESQKKDKSEPPSAFARLRRDKHVGSYKFPDKFDDVLALPGIGRYTAGAICSIAFNQPVPILDGNVIRVLTRIFGIGGNPREKETNELLWHVAEELIRRAKAFGWGETPGEPARDDARPTKNRSCSYLNQSLMELGALVCTPRQPKCPDCPIKKLCVAFHENRVEELPNPGKRATATARHFVAFIVEQNGRFLVRQRTAGVVNAHLWEFPNAEVEAGILPVVESGFQPDGKISGRQNYTDRTRKISGGKMPHSLAGQRPAVTSLARAAKKMGLELSDAKPLCTVKHSITRFRITLEAFHVILGGTSYTSPHSKRASSGARVTRPSGNVGVWLTTAQMNRLAFSSAHKKILARLPTPKVSGATPETTRGTRVLP